MKHKKYLIQGVIGLAFSVFAMWIRGLFEAETTLDIIMAVSDGFSITGLLMLGIGSLVWISTTGFFDIFGYAFKKGAHALVPGFFKDVAGRYYDYKVEKEVHRAENKTERSTAIVGAGFLVLGLIFVGIWYMMG